MPQSRSASGNVEYWGEREGWIKYFLLHPEGLKGEPIAKTQYYLEGKQLWTKPPHKAKKGLARAKMAEWLDGKLYVYNTGAPLGRQTLELAREIGIEVANDDQ